MSPDRVAQDAPWLLWLLNAMQSGQEALLQILHSVGLTPDVDGQPAWPWSRRLAGENLLLDVGQARAMAWSLLAVVVIICLLVLAALWWRHLVAPFQKTRIAASDRAADRYCHSVATVAGDLDSCQSQQLSPQSVAVQ